MSKTLFTEGIINLILNELKKNGFAFILLTSGVGYFGYIAHQNSDYFYRENMLLKEENKELRNLFHSEIVSKQNEITNNQREMIFILKNKQNDN